MKNQDRIFQCKNCGQAVQGWHTAHEQFDCGCGNYQPCELTEAEYRYVYGDARYEQMQED